MARSDTLLLKGEQKRPNGTFAFRWSDEYGKRHTLYAQTLEELRAKEEKVSHDQLEKIKTEARFVTINDMFERWKEVKRGIKDNTFQNYKYMYSMFVAPTFGKKRLSSLIKSDVKKFYNSLVEDKGLSVSTIDTVHNVLHQVLEMAADDCYIRRNPSDNVLKELKQAHALQHEKRRALTKPEQDLFLDFLQQNPQYQHWYPIFAVMVGTGLRVGELVGLRWCDIDLEDQMIDVNHTLVFYNHETNGFYCNVHSPKTINSIRKVPMLNFVKDAFLLEREHQEASGIHSTAVVDGYSDFVFVNRFGDPQHQGTLNKALRRIIRDCNDSLLAKGDASCVLLPHFSCHSLRHTFATRMCEAGVNIKVIQDTLGHSDVSTTLNIYADATKELKKSEFNNFEGAWV